MLFFHDGTPMNADFAELTVAGWTGRSAEAVAHHIRELTVLGVAPPSQVPLFYRVSHSLLMHTDLIEVLGHATSGEAEPLLAYLDGAFWLGLGSDHTDRDLEAVSVAASKQACPKPVADTFWRFDDIAAHVDDLILTCHIQENGAWTLYQEGTLAQILPLPSLAASAKLGGQSAMLCGTLPAIGAVRPAAAYRMALTDPVRNKTMTLKYRVKTLEIVK